MDSLRSVWNQMPAVRLLLALMAGIGICIASASFLPVFLVSLFICLGFLIYINQVQEVARVYRLRYISGVAVILIMLAAGYVVTYFNTERLDPHHFSVDDPAVPRLSGIISEPVIVKEKTINSLVKLQGNGGKVLLSIVRSERSEALDYGDELIFTGKVKEYDPPKNPDQFDYRQYQSMHHIWHRAYLSPADWKLRSRGNGNILLSRIYAVRTHLLSLIKREVAGENELAVATAIMLGYRDYVTDDVTQAYAGSGVLHVLSVSGLHVAVLYFVLNLLLGWMDKHRRLEILKGALVIIIMLFYAGLTGLSPPVLRSVWMFSLIVVAKLLDRDVSMYNVLAVSCMVLLLWDPYFIADPGFQLSYIAVAGIVYIYPLFFGLIEDTTILRTKYSRIDTAGNWLSRWAWGLICVSIAAQIATFPISLFYFHTFPNYFLLSNLLVIPLSNFVLIAGMVLFLVGWSDTLISWVGWIFDHLLWLLNNVVFAIDVLPFALSKGIVVTVFEMIFLFAIIIMVCWYLADRRAKVLITGLGLVLMLCTSFSIHNISNQRKRELAVYSVKGMKAISIIAHNTVYYDFDSAVIHNEKTMRFNIRDHWYVSGVSEEVPMDSISDAYVLPFGKLYEAEGKRLMVLDQEIKPVAKQSLRIDVLVLSGSAHVSIKDISQSIAFSRLVFDTSNKPKRIKQWREECDTLGINYHDCSEKAFVMEW